MGTPVTITHFATLAPPWNLTQLDANFDALNAALAATSSPPTFQIFTSNGTWTKPAGITLAIVEVLGAGGGGGGANGSGAGSFAASGGGAGAYARKMINVTGITSSAIVVGTGGTGGAAGLNNGVDGGASSWTDSGNTITANGGIKGLFAITGVQPGGAGGTATGGDINIKGSDGGGSAVTGGPVSFGGYGGVSFFGGMPAGAILSGAASAAGTNGGLGSGGSGAVLVATVTGVAGGNGGNGIVIVWQF